MLAIIQKIIVELRLVTKIFGSLNSTMHFFFSNQIRRISPPPPLFFFKNNIPIMLLETTN